MLEDKIQRANALIEEGHLVDALHALAEVGEQATDAREWPIAIRAHRISAEILHRLGEVGPALSHAAEGLYLCIEHMPEDTLESLGQVLAFVEQAVAERRWYVAQEVGPGMMRTLLTLKPAPGAEPWLDLAIDVSRLIALVGDAAGDAESEAHVEALALAALIDRATEGHLNLNMWVHSTAFEHTPARPGTRPPDGRGVGSMGARAQEES